MTLNRYPKTRDEVRALQLARLNEPSELSRGLPFVATNNRFYAPRLEGLSLPLKDLDEIYAMPATTKDDLVEDQAENRPYGSNLSFPLQTYTRIHATSGTTGRRLHWLDTPESWEWNIRCWLYVLEAVGVGEQDCVFAAFGFGPFLGFWSGFEAAARVGALSVAGGAQSSRQRLDWIMESGATIVLSTPTYALRLAEVANESGIDLSRSKVRATIHAGEPGASIVPIRQRIEQAFGAHCWDHAGMTEVGPWGYECPHHEGLHLIETEFIGEVRSLETDTLVEDGELGELVLTNLGRWGMPVLRYRTGDLVRPRSGICSCGSPFVCFPGGVLARADDMIQIRGINVYPSSIEAIVREDPRIIEYQAEAMERVNLWELQIRIEVLPESEAPVVCEQLSDKLHNQLGFRPIVQCAGTDSLPRFELKAKRFRVHRRA